MFCLADFVSFLRCKELVQAYIQDMSPEAVLMVGGDMQKIRHCFWLLKVMWLIKYGTACRICLPGHKEMLSCWQQSI